MISRSTLIGALVVTELVIVAAAGQAISGGGSPSAPLPPGAHTHFGFVFKNHHRHRHHAPAAAPDVTSGGSFSGSTDRGSITVSQGAKV